MAGNVATLIVKILADSALAEKALAQSVPAALRGTQNAMANLAIPAGIALGAVAAFGASAVGAASKVEQSWGGLEAVFGANADQAKGLATSAARDVGLASSQYAELAAIIGSQLKGMGTASDQLVPKTDQLIKLGADLAATYGGSTADAVSAVSALLRGERDPIERYGVSLRQTDIDAQAAALGIKKVGGSLTAQQSGLATMALLMARTSDAQGQFAAQTNTAAEAQQVASAEWENAQATLGAALLPAVTAVTTALAAMAQWVGENSKVVLILGGVIGGLATAILAINIAFKLWQAATMAMAVAQGALNAVLALNPIALVVIAIAALIAILVLAYKNSETFRRIVDQAFQAVLGVVRTVVGAITAIFRVLGPVLLLPIRVFYGLAVLAIRGVGVVFQWLLGVARAVWGVLGPLLVGPFRAFQRIVGAVIAVVGGIIRAFVGGLTSLWATLTAVLTGPFLAFQRIVGQVVRVVGGLFRGLADLVNRVFGAIKSVVDKIGHAIDSLPQLPSIHLPFGLAAGGGGGPAPAPRVAGRSAGTVALGGGGRQTITLVLDGEVFGRATVASIRRYDRRNGAAQLVPTWS